MESPQSSAFETVLGYTFHDKDLLKEVLIRKSAVQEGVIAYKSTTKFDYCKFLGNRVLGLLLADLLYKEDSCINEGLLTMATATILSRYGSLKDLAVRFRLNKFIIAGSGESLLVRTGNQRILFEHTQALFGAIWLDVKGNFLKVREVFCKHVAHDKKASGLDEIIIEQYQAKPSDILMLEARLSYSFNDRNYLLKSLVRQSAINENLIENVYSSFQALEFLGDKVLGCVIANILAQGDIAISKGSLTLLLNKYTDNEVSLPKVARMINLGSAFIMGNGERQLQVDENNKALADHMEALLGAVWLDCGKNFLVVERIIRHLWNRAGLFVERQVSKKSTPKDFPAPFWGKPSVSIAKFPSQRTLNYKSALLTRPPQAKKVAAFPAPFWNKQSGSPARTMSQRKILNYKDALLT